MEGPGEWLCFNRYNNNNITTDQKGSLSFRWLALVPGDLNTYYWIGSGWTAGDGRQICIRPSNWNIYHHRMGAAGPFTKLSF